MSLIPITDPTLMRAKSKVIENKRRIYGIVEDVYHRACNVITQTDDKSYHYLFPTYSFGWGRGPDKMRMSYPSISLLQLSDPIIPEVINALKKLFPTAKIELKVATCSGGNAHNLNCKCGGHQNCISIEWSAI